MENDVSESREQNIVQPLSSKYKSIPIGRTENTENNGKNFSGRNVGNSRYLLIMMMDRSTTFQEEQIQNKIIERLANEFSLIYLPRGQSSLMRK